MGPSKPLEEWTTDELLDEFTNIRIYSSVLALEAKTMNKEQYDWQDEIVKELRRREVF